MRNIKFRSWNENENKMTTPFAWVNSSNMFSTQMCSSPTHELMLFTGLVDLCGVDIYEGDVCFLVDTEYQNEQYEVAYSDSQCKFYLKDHAGRLQGFMDDYDLKVIGNIYQNPELLGGKA